MPSPELVSQSRRFPDGGRNLAMVRVSSERDMVRGELMTVNEETPHLSVVIPVFNEEKNIPDLMDRLSRVLRGLGKSFEVIFVDDGSRDSSLELLKKIQEEMKEVRVIAFNRNYGQHAAIFAGFEHTSVEIVITLDADLQNPPE